MVGKNKYYKRRPGRARSLKRSSGSTIAKRRRYLGPAAIGLKKAAAVMTRMNKMRVYRSLNAFPQYRYVNHKYVDTVTLTSPGTPGDPGFYQFRVNSLHDPDYSGTGHQPLYYDEMSARYAYYTVVSASIECTFATEAASPTHFQIHPDQDLSVPLTWFAGLEQRGYTAQQKMNTRNTPLKIKNYVNVPAFFHTNRSSWLADDTNKIASGSNATGKQACYWTLLAYPQSVGDTLASGYVVHIKIRYTTLWREPIEATKS